MTRSPLFNFGLGIFFGVMAGAAGAVHVCTNHAQHHAEEVGRSLDRLNQQISDMQKTAAELERRAQTCETAAGQMKADLQSRSVDDGWYTLLYQEADKSEWVPSDQNVAVAGLANAIRPGLGEILLKLAPPSTQELRFNGVLPGYIRPIVAPAHIHFVHTRTPGALGQTFPNAVQ